MVKSVLVWRLGRDQRNVCGEGKESRRERGRVEME